MTAGYKLYQNAIYSNNFHRVMTWKNGVKCVVGTKILTSLHILTVRSEPFRNIPGWIYMYSFCETVINDLIFGQALKEIYI